MEKKRPVEVRDLAHTSGALQRVAPTCPVTSPRRACAHLPVCLRDWCRPSRVLLEGNPRLLFTRECFIWRLPWAAGAGAVQPEEDVLFPEETFPVGFSFLCSVAESPSV